MVLLKDWAGRWLHHRTVEAGNLPVLADNKNHRMSAVATDKNTLFFPSRKRGESMHHLLVVYGKLFLQLQEKVEAWRGQAFLHAIYFTVVAMHDKI